MFIVTDDDGKNDHKSYNSIYFNYFLISYYRVRLFLAMQVRVMASCMESHTDTLESTASAQSGRREVTVCFSPMSLCLLVPATDVYHTLLFPWIAHAAASRADFMCSSD